MNDHDPMTTERPDDEPEGGRWREEDLLEWVLDERARAATPREDIARDEEAASALRDLEGFVADCRASLADERLTDDVNELTRAVLDGTTREDLRLRGDLRLVGRFVTQSLRTSVLLRVVAASLLLHIAALPVLAYFSFFQPSQPDTLITISPRDLGALPYAAADEEPEPKVTEPELETDLAAVPPAGVLFEARLAEQGLSNLADFAEPPFETVVWGDDLGLVLWTERELDRAEEGDPSDVRLLRFALENLSDLLSGEPASEPAALRRLAESAWQRARREGWTEDLDAEFSVDPTRLRHGLELRGDAWAEVYLQAAGKDF